MICHSRMSMEVSAKCHLALYIQLSLFIVVNKIRNNSNEHAWNEHNIILVRERIALFWLVA